MIKVLVSACLIGSPVRYDGRDKKSSHPVLERWIGEGRVVSVCPEMLGGLPTPRPPSEIVRDSSPLRVIADDGRDVTDHFKRGARCVIDQANTHDITIAILKEGSPSCGSSFVYDGTFSGTKVAGEGVTTAMLRKRGLVVFSENEIDAAAEYVAQLEQPDA